MNQKSRTFTENSSLSHKRGRHGSYSPATTLTPLPWAQVLMFLLVCTCMFISKPKHEFQSLQVFSPSVKILPIWWQARGMVLMTQVAPPNSSAKPKNSLPLNAASHKYRAALSFYSPWKRERACPLLNSFIMWGVRHYEVEKKWKRGKKLKKGKERKSEAVVGRGKRLPEGIMGFGKTRSLYVCVFWILVLGYVMRCMQVSLENE